MELLAVTELLFSPFKVGFLILWVYLCMYLIQRFEFSPLISSRIKVWSNLLMLVAAPFVLLFAFFYAVFKKIEDTGSSFIDALTATFGHAIQAIKYTTLGVARGSSIILLDPSGKSIREVYGNQSKDDSAGRIVAVIFCL